MLWYVLLMLVDLKRHSVEKRMSSVYSLDSSHLRAETRDKKSLIIEQASLGF